MGSNFVYSRRDLIVVAIAVAIIVLLLGLGFGLTASNVREVQREKMALSAFNKDGSPKTSRQRAEDILSVTPVVDGHNDFAMTIRELFMNDLTKFDFARNSSDYIAFLDYPMDHTDLPRMKAGHLGGQFWSAYAPCDSQYKDAVQLFLEQIDVIHRLIEAYPEQLQFVSEAEGIEQAFANKKVASMIGVESGHAIGSSLGVLRVLYNLGARYMTLTHSCNTPWADSSEAENDNIPVRSNGLSNFGELVVKEMNRLGMMVDLSHVSSDTMLDALAVSRAPVIFSHSSARALCSETRNVPDEVLRKTATNRGIVMVNFYSCFLVDGCANATIQTAVDHINHIRTVAGIDHVGIGADFNGVVETAAGLEDVSKYPDLFAALIDDPTYEWTNEDLGKLASGNLIRVFKEVEGVRDALKSEAVYQDWIMLEDLGNNTDCLSEIE